SSVAAYLPSRSTTYALCWGTTTAVLAITTSTSNANSSTTNSPPLIVISSIVVRFPGAPYSFCCNPQGEPLDPFNPASLVFFHECLPGIMDSPCGAMQFRLADAAWCQVFKQDCAFAHHRVHDRHFLISGFDPSRQRPPKDQERKDRES